MRLILYTGFQLIQEPCSDLGIFEECEKQAYSVYADNSLSTCSVYANNSISAYSIYADKKLSANTLMRLKK